MQRLEEDLIDLAAAVGTDGGDAVLRVARDLYARAFPFDAAELAVAHATGFQRWTFTDDQRPIAADDLLLLMALRPEVRRFDDLHELEALPRTRNALQQRGLRALLVFPLSGAGGVEGAVVLAAAHPWAFVGVSLRVLEPVARMLGLALKHASGLTRSDGSTPAVQPSGPAAVQPEHTRILEAIEAELQSEREKGHKLTAERDAALAECHRLRSGREPHEATEAPPQVAAPEAEPSKEPHAGPPDEPRRSKKRRRRR